MRIPGDMSNGDLGSTLVSNSVNGNEIYTTYIDASGNLKVAKALYVYSLSATTITTGATSVA